MWNIFRAKHQWHLSKSFLSILSNKYIIMETNPRGIPKAPFVEDVDAYMVNKSADEILKNFSERISKYRFMESSMAQRKAALETKIPEIKKSLEMDSEKPINIQYELNDTLYAKAAVQPQNTVNLWLGANVMLEYTLEEAQQLLQSKLDIASNSKRNAEEDLEFLRDQITTMEVNTARIFNWDVKKRREAKAKSSA